MSVNEKVKMLRRLCNCPTQFYNYCSEMVSFNESMLNDSDIDKEAVNDNIRYWNQVASTGYK